MRPWRLPSQALRRAPRAGGGAESRTVRGARGIKGVGQLMPLAALQEWRRARRRFGSFGRVGGGRPHLQEPIRVKGAVAPVRRLPYSSGAPRSCLRPRRQSDGQCGGRGCRSGSGGGEDVEASRGSSRLVWSPTIVVAKDPAGAGVASAEGRGRLACRAWAPATRPRSRAWLGALAGMGFAWRF